MSNTDKIHQSNFDAALLGIALERTAPDSLQAQLTEGLRHIILNDPGTSGARLPASRKLAGELSVSRTTVQIAYDQLISEGYLTSRMGSGTFVADNLPHLSPPVTKPAGPRPKAQAWHPFHTGIPDQALFPYQSWARHLERAWRAPENALLARPDPMGWYPLRQAIADHLSAWRGLPCDPGQVLITSGAWEAFELICRALLPGGSAVAVEDPGWSPLREVLDACGAHACSLRTDHEGLNPADIPTGVAAAIVTPSRHYPTGATMPLARRAALLDWAQQTGGLVVEDDYDSEFRYKGHPLPSLAGLDGLRHCIYIGSFSKLLSPALRIGYAVLPQTHVDPARHHLARTGTRASLIPQPALASFMTSGEFATHLRRMRRIYARRQEYLLSELAPLSDLLDLSPDPAGMHLCARLTPKLAGRITDRHIAARAQERGVFLRALSSHSALPDPPQGLLLGYAGHDEAALGAAAHTLARLLRDIA